MKAYEKLKFYQNICEIRRTIYKITERFARSHHRLVAQMRDAIRSAKQNIIEGYNKDSAGEFLHSIKISRGSLAEFEGDLDDCFQDNLINKDEYNYLKNLTITTNYQMEKYMDSLVKLEKNGLWKKRWFLQPKVTSRNSKATSGNLDVTSKGNLPNGNFYRSRGSALIITLLVIMVISAVGIGVGRLTLSEIKQTVNLENSVGAQAIAESGLEHGLLLFRFNHNAEVCAEKTAEVSCSATSTPVKIDMGNGASYDILMYHKLGAGEPEIVTTSGTTPALGKDENVQYDLTDVSGNLYLKWTYKDLGHPPTPEEKAQMRLEVTAYDADGKITGKKLFLHDNQGEIQPLSTLDDGGTTIGATSLRIKSMGGDINNYTLSSDKASDELGSRYTYVESTGYFGNTKRKLQIKLDRHSGQILGTYDFVLYSGQGPIGQ